MNVSSQLSKLRPEHLARKAVVYLRQSSEKQVQMNVESQRLQYALRDRASALGWKHVEIIDADLGASAATGAPRREGFERLLAQVALGDVGIVFSREVSRLSRTDKDWCHLQELCQIFGTLMGDEERIYDLDCTDDLLVLGIKATLSVVELRVLKLRMTQGMQEKAKRGELFRLLPPGYALDGTGSVVKDPNARVREAMGLVFSTFREASSVRQTYRWFHDHGIELPVNKNMAGRYVIAWKLPSHSFVSDVLRNPFYAGAYVYGRRPMEVVLSKGRPRKRQAMARAAEDCRVFIRDHHEGYIDWEAYRENLRMMRRNVQSFDKDKAIAAVRSGQGLLAGLLRCGRCGRKLHVRYWGKQGTAARYLCKGDFEAGGRYCLGFGGATVDRRLGDELLRVISPLGVRASLEALAQLGVQNDARREALRQQVDQLDYEARRAFEQYNEVDPRNRLVAAELERRWDAKLQELERVRSALSDLEREARPLTAEEEHEILAVGEDFARVWHSADCPVELKKKIARVLIEEIIVDLDDGTNRLSLIIHWKGGSHSRFEMEKPRSGVGRKTSVGCDGRPPFPRYASFSSRSFLGRFVLSFFVLFVPLWLRSVVVSRPPAERTRLRSPGRRRPAARVRRPQACCAAPRPARTAR